MSSRLLKKSFLCRMFKKCQMRPARHALPQGKAGGGAGKFTTEAYLKGTSQGGNLPATKQMALFQHPASQRGSMVVWLAGMIPILLVVFAVLVNIILYVDAKMRMQAAADRGVYAGASYLSHVMNEVARLNWRFREQYLRLKEDFIKPAEPTKKWIDDRVKECRDKQAALAGEMDRLRRGGYREANDVAKGVIEANLDGMPHITGVGYTPLYGRYGDAMFDMGHDCPDGECISKEIIDPSEIEGFDFDPNKHEEYKFVVDKYLVKSGDFVAIAGHINGFFNLPLLSRFLAGEDGGFGVHALAAAQPFGGGVKEFAHVDAKNLEDAEASDAGKKFLYHPALIPVRSVLGGIDVEY